MIAAPSTLISTGTRGLDEVLCGGLPQHRLYLLQGDPGVGKTTLALRFLMEGVAHGERCLYITLSETREELEAVAAAHGFSLAALSIYEMSAAESPSGEHDENTLYLPAEVELGERISALLAEVDRVQPSRIVLDSCSELRLLAQSPLRFRRQILTLKEDLVRRNCTVLLLENPTSVGGDPLLQSLVHGVVEMEQRSPLYGAERRRLRVVKMREMAFRGGYHDFVIRRGGVEVFPRLVASEHHTPFERGTVTSGVPALDALLGGGLDRGTSALFVGATGTGKSTIAAQYSRAGARRGDIGAYFTFDEGVETLRTRSENLGMSLGPFIDNARIQVKQVDPAELSPGEFASVVRSAVEDRGARLVVIDSLNGFLQAMPEEHFLTVQLHELLSFLRQRGILTLLLMAQHGVLGRMDVPVDVSYLADTVMMTRYFEASGRVRKALSVVKRRSGGHEDTIREIKLGPGGLEVGEPLSNFRGVLTGVPELRERDSSPTMQHVDLDP